MNPFEEGDKVFDIRYGWGEVKYLTPEEDELTVCFEFNTDITYVQDGREVDYHYPSLKHYDYSLEFPRLMEVSDDGKSWMTMNVYCADFTNAITLHLDCGEYKEWPYYREIEKSKKIVELTFKDISEGKGVGVDPKLIRIKK